MFCAVTLLALLATVQGRAVNISNTWVLPEEGFPVFYRYFRDRISWYEADAVCQFHHANLVTVDTTAQYDAVRAYLKELDISSAVWVGLIRSNPDGDFTWTDYRGMSGDGYWSSAPDGRAAPLCAAANPAADYRWEARTCGGPTVASFICELPVPQWALGNEGCMIRALPALTILYLPESAAVQLTADCGLAGVKRIECTGNMKREDLLRDLSCAEAVDMSSTPNLISISTSPLSTEALYTDEDATKEITIEESITTEHEGDINQPINMTTTSIPQVSKVITKLVAKPNNVILSKIINLDVIHNNNLQSNYIPKIANQDAVLNMEQLEKLEDEKFMQHKMLYEEIARLGNIDNIFTQPTDHFVPPLVMAKAKISDDMTVLSLAEKHAQQIAEQQFPKHSFLSRQTDLPATENYKMSSTPQFKIDTTELPLIITTDALNSATYENKFKNITPKKYSEKYEIKNKISKMLDVRVPNTYNHDKKKKETETTTLQNNQYEFVSNIDEEDPVIDLTVVIKDVPIKNDQKLIFTNYTGDISKFENIQSDNLSIHENVNISLVDDVPSSNVHENSTSINTIGNFTLNHEVIKIALLDDNNESITPIVFEVATKFPTFLNESITTTAHNSEKTEISLNISNIANINQEGTSTKLSFTNNNTENYIEITRPIVVNNMFLSNANVDLKSNSSIAHKLLTPIENKTFVIDTPNATLVVENGTIEELPVQNNYTDAYILKMSNETVETYTPLHQELEKNTTETSEIDDFQSPLLSAANEPLHRPNRSRRPQPSQNRNKFNPFRILG